MIKADHTMQLIDGKATAKAIKEEIKLEVDKLREQGKKIPHLAAVLVGNDGASESYVGYKVKDCHEVGFESSLIRFENDITEDDLLAEVDRLNKDPKIDGYIVQLPLPSHIDSKKILLAIDAKKDVDGFHPENVGRMTLGLPCFLPATPNGIMELISRHDIDTKGKHVVVVGRSNIVGRPMSILLSGQGYPGEATVTLCHRNTLGLSYFTKQADILIVAVGKPQFIKGDMVKEGAVVIDVGTTRVEDATAKRGWRLKGDVDFEQVAPKAAWITPVPGGVGPMTRVALLLNTLRSAKKEIYA
jgi:methylenetetrahydrofolate dehydrogenase (NADP+)/methenyltetrahydrofolate cyclohydrolase